MTTWVICSPLDTAIIGCLNVYICNSGKGFGVNGSRCFFLSVFVQILYSTFLTDIYLYSYHCAKEKKQAQHQNDKTSLHLEWNVSNSLVYIGIINRHVECRIENV